MVGSSVGSSDGSSLGDEVGISVGDVVRGRVPRTQTFPLSFHWHTLTLSPVHRVLFLCSVHGSRVGSNVGYSVGSSVGSTTGSCVGSSLGSWDGVVVGGSVRSTHSFSFGFHTQTLSLSVLHGVGLLCCAHTSRVGSNVGNSVGSTVGGTLRFSVGSSEGVSTHANSSLSPTKTLNRFFGHVHFSYVGNCLHVLAAHFNLFGEHFPFLVSAEHTWFLLS